jgi:hypothetical protein
MLAAYQPAKRSMYPAVESTLFMLRLPGESLLLLLLLLSLLDNDDPSWLNCKIMREGGETRSFSIRYSSV